MMIMKGVCIVVVVVLVVVARGGPVSGAKGKDDGRPVVNPIIRSAVIETCLQQQRDDHKDSNGRATTKVEIEDVRDMLYKAKGKIITVTITFNRPEMEPMNQFPRCEYELIYNRLKFTVPDESPFAIRNIACVL